MAHETPPPPLPAVQQLRRWVAQGRHAPQWQLALPPARLQSQVKVQQQKVVAAAAAAGKRCPHRGQSRRPPWCRPRPRVSSTCLTSPRVASRRLLRCCCCRFSSTKASPRTPLAPLWPRFPLASRHPPLACPFRVASPLGDTTRARGAVVDALAVAARATDGPAHDNDATATQRRAFGDGCTAGARNIGSGAPRHRHARRFRHWRRQSGEQGSHPAVTPVTRLVGPVTADAQRRLNAVRRP